MILRRLSLFGITRYDLQVDVDFEALGPGVIAFAGGNGAGKTTLLEASGPGALFRELPTRDPDELHASTRPGGGWLQLDFTLGADDYTARIDVDKRGQQQAYLTRGGVPIVSGKVREFDQAIAKLVGTSDAFYASVFGLQGGGGKLASLTVGDRKAIFRWILGLDRIAKLRDAASKQLAQLDGKDVTRLATDLQQLQDELVTLRATLPDLDTNLVAANHDADVAKADRDAAADAIALVEQRAAALREIKRLDDAAATATTAARAKLEALDAVKAKAPADAGEAPADPAIARAALDEGKQLATDADRVEAEARTKVTAATTAKADVDRAARSAGLLGDVPCGGGEGFTGCQFLVDAVKARGQLADLRDKQKAADAAALHANTRAKSHRAAAPDAAGMAALARAVTAAETAQRNWQSACTAVANHAAQIASADAAYRAAAQVALTARRARQAVADPPEAPAVDVQSLNREVAEATAAVNDATRALAKVRGEIEALARQQEATDAKLKKAELLAADTPALQFLVKALGPDGIQALEIDAAGPQVASMANDLLLACYGPRFTIEVRTQRAMGSKDGHAEDLEIMVMDAQEGRTGPLGSLSGGEQVIVDEAVRTALAMFAARRLEAPIRTLWRDETAGSLTPENARRYVQMLRRAAEIGGFHQILFVAHDPDVIACADAVVRVQGDGTLQIERP